MDFGSLQVGTRRSSSVAGLASFAASRSSISGPSGNPSDVTERRRSSILSLAGHDVRRRSSAINLNFDNKKGNAKSAVDEPILLCKDEDGYLFFSMTSDGLLNYKVASRVSGSMTKYLVDASKFNPEGAPVVVLSSPASGTGFATQAYSKILLPILKHFRIAHSHIALKDEDTASYLAANGQFTPGTIFILLCGDGVIHEVVNGIARNPHFEDYNTSIRICPVPCGSGNGLAASLKILNMAQGIRAIFKSNFQRLPVLSITAPSLGDTLYGMVVFSYGLHAAIVHDCAQPQDSGSGNKFQEAAKRHLHPPHLYQADIQLASATRFPNFASTPSNHTVGSGVHTYCLITRCSNLETEWKIAPLANPLAENGKFDLVRMGDMDGTELGSILMDGYKAGAQINRSGFEYYRASEASITITESDQTRRTICIDGAIHTVAQNEEIRVGVTNSVGPMRTTIYIQKL